MRSVNKQKRRQTLWTNSTRRSLIFTQRTITFFSTLTRLKQGDALPKTMRTFFRWRTRMWWAQRSWWIMRRSLIYLGWLVSTEKQKKSRRRKVDGKNWHEKSWDVDNFAIFVFFLDLMLFCEENIFIRNWVDCINKKHNLSKINQFHSFRLNFELDNKK